jgi:hypothetical protein
MQKVEPGACTPVQAVGMDNQTPVYRGADHLPDCPRLALRKRKLSSSANRMYDTDSDDPEGLNPKQPRHSTGAQLNMLWSRWRQLADRRRRRK